MNPTDPRRRPAALDEGELEVEVAGFVEVSARPTRAVGEVVRLVDGPFRITRVQVGARGVVYFGVWLSID